MIQFTPLLTIRESCLQMTFTGASGPGGQNVNKVTSAVQLRFDIQACQDLPPAVRARL
ncbi:MAG TPA: peptide chain release factor-like protein, partial [Desulfobacterales bacterium]|nr:peptide chain release factor-like protein [Desulfobacterales bacterium]